MKQILVLLFVAMSATAFAQSSATVKEGQSPVSKTAAGDSRIIVGLVTDNDLAPLPGVNIVVYGTTTGTTTDADGFYALYVPEGSVLIYSFIGYLTVAVFVGESHIINVMMNPDAVLTLDERMKK